MSDILLVGSRALLARGIKLAREPSDWDYIASFEGLQRLTRALRTWAHGVSVRVESIPLSDNKTVLRVHDGPYRGMHEVEIAWAGTSGSDLLRQERSVAIEVAGLPVHVITLDEAYALKMSHRYLKNSPHFRKTMDDIWSLRGLGAKVPDRAWFKRREDETYWYKHPSLNVKKGDFFKDDGVKYVYDHDDIHRAVAHYRSYQSTEPDPEKWDKIPAYTLYMKDGAEVQCSKEKFFEKSENVRLFGVLEEAQVLALERSQIPFRGKVDPRRSFDIALMKVCTSITSGWFREYAWEHFHQVEKMYEPDYADRFWAAEAAGKVRKLEPGETGPYG